MATLQHRGVPENGRGPHRAVRERLGGPAKCPWNVDDTMSDEREYNNNTRSPRNAVQTYTYVLSDALGLLWLRPYVYTRARAQQQSRRGPYVRYYELQYTLATIVNTVRYWLHRQRDFRRRFGRRRVVRGWPPHLVRPRPYGYIVTIYLSWTALCDS